MATLSNEEIEQLQQQLKEKTEELRVIYDKLVEAGVSPVPDDFLDNVAGGVRRTEFERYDTTPKKSKDR